MPWSDAETSRLYHGKLLAIRTKTTTTICFPSNRGREQLTKQFFPSFGYVGQTKLTTLINSYTQERIRHRPHLVGRRDQSPLTMEHYWQSETKPTKIVLRSNSANVEVPLSPQDDAGWRLAHLAMQSAVVVRPSQSGMTAVTTSLRRRRASLISILHTRGTGHNQSKLPIHAHSPTQPAQNSVASVLAVFDMISTGPWGAATAYWSSNRPVDPQCTGHGATQSAPTSTWHKPLRIAPIRLE